MTTTIPVGDPAGYSVTVGRGLSGAAPHRLPGASTAVVVADSHVAPLAAAITAALRGAGVRVESASVPDGEAGKSLETAAALWERLGELRLTRSDALVAIGGGATTDVVGFVAATWLRGIRVLNVPTTLLGMVDAAIGGKTGINTTAGKNLVGAFHEPAGVLVDLDVLVDLPHEQWVNGLAEVVKAGFIADPVILDVIESDPAAATSRTSGVAGQLIERAIRVKASVVAGDFREAGPRESLNYGHTLGHALERLEEYVLPHGHAVAIGMVYAAALGRACDRLDDATAKRHRSVLEAVGLPTSYRADAWPQLRELMRVDKKARGDRQRFVVLDGPGRPGILEAPDEDVLRAAWAEVTA